jgi:hypothetical protein
MNQISVEKLQNLKLINLAVFIFLSISIRFIQSNYPHLLLKTARGIIATFKNILIIWSTNHNASLISKLSINMNESK